MKEPENWLDELLPFPRPEYAKQTEALLTDLLWRSPGSSLSAAKLLNKLGDLKRAALKADSDRLVPRPNEIADPDRLVPRRRHGGGENLTETYTLAKDTDVASLIACPAGIPTPIEAVLESVVAPRARGNRTDACVPLHPATASLQTLDGLVNKKSPANLGLAIETMGWLGGAPAKGYVAATFLQSYATKTSAIRDGATGLLENLFPAIAAHVWQALPGHFQAEVPGWPVWTSVVPASLVGSSPAALAQYPHSPFAWFWRKWTSLCDPTKKWHELLPARRFVDWAMCLLRTGLAFAYLWEAEFFVRLHERIALRHYSSASLPPINRLRSLLEEGAFLATFEPPSVPASQKNIWPATADLLARGWEARKLFHEVVGRDTVSPPGTTVADVLDYWVNTLTLPQLNKLAPPLQTEQRTANNQKEFVKYLVLPRSSDDDSIDQADFYSLARTNSRSNHVWFHPGPEWLVVVTSLLCEAPGGQCTLGALVEDLSKLGVRVERSVLVGFLEEAGLSTDSPDADNALVIRSGF
jgi:hypothetical protein